MGFFGNKNKDTVPAPKREGSAPAVDKEEPLLCDDAPPAAGSSPDWADVEAKHDPMDPEEGDADLSVVSSYYKRDKSAVNDNEGWINTKIPDFDRKRLAAACDTKYLLGCCGVPAAVKYALWGGAAVAVIALAMISGGSPGTFNKNVNVAFVGNSYFFVNDLPRLMERVSDGKIFQDSCLHGSGSILNLLKTGNGMYQKWNTQNAMVGGVEWTNQNGQEVYLYDYGACSVPELLTGHDNMLSYNNQYGAYINDGSNPCLQDSNYLDYQESFNYTDTWDYVVITDQSKRMCFDDAREEALMAFNYTYGPILKQIGAIPIIVQPHAFWSANANMTGLGDIPTFTSMIKEGTDIYQEYLNTKLGFNQRSRVARVGDAFLTVYEEDQELWYKLFLSDGIHPSGYGSYLYALMIHGAIYRSMPKKSSVILEDAQELFSKSRMLHATNETQYPTQDEAKYLYSVARKVALLGFTPESYKTTVSQQEAADYSDYDEAANENDEYDYNADGDDGQN
jgi:hypothetical protein